MGRRIPLTEAYTLTHPYLALAILVAWISATIAILAGLCISWLWRNSTPIPQPLPKPPSPPPPLQAPNVSIDETYDSRLPAGLPPPPAVVAAAIQARQPPPPPPPPPPPKHKDRKERAVDPYTHGPIPPSMTMKSASSRKSLSMRIPEGLSKIRTSKKDRHEKQTEEPSIWKKTIILGERCKVPSDDEDEDDKGNSRHRNYHPKTPKSLPISRESSFSAIPS